MALKNDIVVFLLCVEDDECYLCVSVGESCRDGHVAPEENATLGLG